MADSPSRKVAPPPVAPRGDDAPPSDDPGPPFVANGAHATRARAKERAQGRKRREPQRDDYDDQGDSVADDLIPQNPDAERSVLGALLIDPTAVARVQPLLDAGDFFTDAHRAIYGALCEVYKQNGRVDFVLLCDHLAAKGKIEDVGGRAYLTSLINAVPTAMHAEHYAAIVERHALRRRTITLGGTIANLAYDTTDPNALVIEVQKRVLEATHRRSVRDMVGMGDLVDRFLKEVEERREGDLFAPASGTRAIPTGFLDLDALTGGLHPTDLIVVAARPGIGKTSLVLQIGVSAAKRGTPVDVFSAEMGHDQVILRMIAAETRLNVHKLRLGQISDDDWEAVQSAADTLRALPIFVDDTPMPTVMDVFQRAQRQQFQHGPGLIIVDYMQLITAPPTHKGNRQEAVAEISRTLKAMCKTLNSPGLIVSQLNRGVEHRKGGRPQLSDLRESGQIEQDADMVLFLHRDMEDDQEAFEETDSSVVETIVAKHRNGPIGTRKLRFDAPSTRFDDLAEGYD